MLHFIIPSDPALQKTLGQFASFRAWFEKRLDDAVAAADDRSQQQQPHSNGGSSYDDCDKNNGNNGQGGPNAKAIDVETVEDEIKHENKKSSPKP